MVGNNLKDTQLQQIVDKTILLYDKVFLCIFFFSQRYVMYNNPTFPKCMLTSPFQSMPF